MCYITFHSSAERGEGNGDEEGGPTAYYKYVTGLLMKSLHFREGIRDEERGPTAYCCYVKALSMKYMMPYTRSERVWIN